MIKLTDIFLNNKLLILTFYKTFFPLRSEAGQRGFSLISCDKIRLDKKSPYVYVNEKYFCKINKFSLIMRMGSFARLSVANCQID